MAVLAIDTLKTAERLIASGLDEAQAKAITETVKEAQEQNLEALVTKGDLRNHDTALRKDLENLEARLTGKLNPVQWMLALVVLAEVLPLLKLLFQ